MKFATKLFFYIFISTALIISGMSIAALIWISNHHMRSQIRSEKEWATLVALKSEDYILRDDRVELYRFFQSIIKANPYMEYVFTQKQNEILVHTFQKGVPRGLVKLPSLEKSYTVDITPISDKRGNRIYHLRIKTESPPDTFLHFGISEQKIRAELDDLKQLMIIVGSILLLTIPAGLALFLSRMVSRPLTILRNNVKRIGSGELDIHIEMSTGDEFEQLVVDINTMAEKLKILRSGLEGEIKERRLAEQMLAVQTELLNNILNHLPHNIFWKDRQFIFLGCNKAFAVEAGLPHPEDVIGKTDYDLPWKPEEADFFRQCDRKVMDKGVPMLDSEETLTCPDGKEKTIVTSKVPLKDQDGHIFGLLGIFYDITERRQMEEAIKHTQKMEAIGTLAGGIAHDFNNILGSIIGYTELSIDDMDEHSRTQSYLNQVLKSALRAKDLVRQILTFSRKHQEERRPLKLSSIVKEEIKLLRSTLPSTIEIHQTIDDNAGMVNADATQMHQIVMNLCTNAAHAIAGKAGTLEISLSSVTVTEEYVKKYHHILPGPFLELKISDTGTGIDSTIIHRIFEPFFTTKAKEKGTGMGLAVVHGIVKDHGGDIIVQSQVGKGTTFTVLLPQVIRTANEKKNPAIEIQGGYERILLVDDEPLLLDLGETILTSLGYAVTVTNNSPDALDRFRHAPDAFDVVISDQTMPHMTGYQLAQQMLKIDPSVRIILCTGYSDTITAEKISAVGIKALLYKPFRKNELAKTIRDVLAGHPTK